MLTFYLAWQVVGTPALAAFSVASGASLAAPARLTAPTRLVLRPAAAAPPVLEVRVDPPTLALTAAADPTVLHYFRLADATVRPLPPTPPALACEPGDAYIAVTPAAARLAEAAPGGASTAIARFLHLRDYFNAEKLAAALLAHVVELGGEADPEGAGVLVLELR